MSRKTNTVKALVAVGAVAGAAFGLAPAQANTVAIATAGPEKVATTAEALITVKGTGFSDAIKNVKFYAPNATTSTCQASSVTVVSSTLMYVKKQATSQSVVCADGKQRLELLDGAQTPARLPGTTLFDPTDAKKTVTFATPTSVSVIAASGGTWTAGSNGGQPTVANGGPTGPTTGGTEITITVGSTVSDKAPTATLGGKPVAGLKVVDATTLKGKAPAGVPGSAPLVVTTNGVPTAAAAGFTYRLAIKSTPNIYVKGAAAAPHVKVEGVGLKPSSDSKTYVSICGVDAPVLTAAVTGTQVKAPTNTAVWVQAPAFNAAGLSTGGGTATNGAVDSTNGGVCVIKVTVDPAGTDTTSVASGVRSITDGQTPDNYSSVVTGSAGFVYAAF